MNKKTFNVLWAIMLVLNLALIGFGVWVVVKVMQHFGVV